MSDEEKNNDDYNEDGPGINGDVGSWLYVLGGIPSMILFFVLLFGLVSTETLCFLSSDEREHLRFRKLGLLTNLIEGAPTLVLQVMFLYKYGWYSLITASFVFTICTLTVKLMRGWMLFLSETCEKDERIPLFKNLRWEDLISLPVFLFHFVLVLVLLVWLDFAAYQDTFRVQWLQLQLEAIGGLDATLDAPTLRQVKETFDIFKALYQQQATQLQHRHDPQ